ncbi:hypothetical protein M9458_055893, partial [Cirrhinus mrigala]
LAVRQPRSGAKRAPSWSVLAAFALPAPKLRISSLSVERQRSVAHDGIQSPDGPKQIRLRLLWPP